MDALIVESGEALGLARELAERRGTSIDDAVVTSLRAALRETLPTERPSPQSLHLPSLEDLTPGQRADYEAMRAVVRKIAPFRVPGGTSDHNHLYDENGLPI